VEQAIGLLNESYQIAMKQKSPMKESRDEQ
jgi:hypothetical protein